MNSPETAAAADAMVAEVERLFALAVKSDPEVNPPWAAYLRNGYGDTEVGIDEWKSTSRAAAEAGEISWEQWLAHGQNIVNSCTYILNLNHYASDTKWDVYINVFRASVVRDVNKIVDTAGAAASGLFSWMPWLVGGLALVVGGVIVYRVVQGSREITLTAQAAGSAVRRRIGS